MQALRSSLCVLLSLIVPAAQSLALQQQHLHLDYNIKAVKGEDAPLAKTASFFVDAFWTDGTTTDAVTLSESERRELVQLQTDDMTHRYGELVGARRLQSALYEATDEASGAIVGCIGVEAALVDPQVGAVLSRSASESLIRGELNAMGARERNQYRKLNLDMLVAELFPEYKAFALVANLAVDPATRRSGLARQLCAKCEEASAAWELPAIVLQVCVPGVCRVCAGERAQRKAGDNACIQCPRGASSHAIC